MPGAITDASGSIALPDEVAIAVLTLLAPADLARVEVVGRAMREVLARAVAVQATTVYWRGDDFSPARQPGESWASVARRALTGLEARLQARDVGHVRFSAGGAESCPRTSVDGHFDSREHAGVYLLQDEGRRLVHGRAVYKKVGKASFLFHARSAMRGETWWISNCVDTSSTVSGHWHAESEALTPDRVEGPWKAPVMKIWHEAPDAEVTRAGADAVEAALAEAARLREEVCEQALAVGDIEFHAPSDARFAALAEWCGGVYELQKDEEGAVMLVDERPFYKAVTSSWSSAFIFHTGLAWVLAAFDGGAHPADAPAAAQKQRVPLYRVYVNSMVLTPDRIAAGKWFLCTGGSRDNGGSFGTMLNPHDFALRAVPAAAGAAHAARAAVARFEDEARAEALSIGSVTLSGDPPYTRDFTRYLGVFKLRMEGGEVQLVNHRPVYQLFNHFCGSERRCLWYNGRGHWVMSKGLFAVVRSPYGFESVPPSSEAWLVKSCAQLPSLIPAAGARWLNGAAAGGWNGRGILAQVVPATARVVRAQQPRDVEHEVNLITTDDT